MSDHSAPPSPAWLSSDEIAPQKRARRRTPEWSFQSWVDRLIDRIVVAPMFVTGLDHASQTTDNARVRSYGRKRNSDSAFRTYSSPRRTRYRKPVQCAGSNWKRGSSLRAAQEGVHRALRAAGQASGCVQFHGWRSRCTA